MLRERLARRRTGEEEGSIVIAVLSGEAAVSWAGYTYLLIFPVLINSYLMDLRRKRSQPLY